MKKTKRTRIFSLVLAFLFCLQSPAFSELSEPEYEDKDENMTTGYFPSPVNLSHLAKNPPKNLTKKALASNIPAVYDMRNTGKLTPVKNQNPYGTCWAHAAIAACESNYLIRSKKGNFSGSLGNSKTLNLSEMYLAWFAYANPDSGKSFGLNNKNSSLKKILNQGGNETKSTAILTRIGIVQESSMPYGKSVSKNAKPGNYKRVLRVKEATFSAPSLSSKEQDKIIKQLVMDKGAVLISYHEDSKFYNKKTNSYYRAGSDSTNHMVAIVGWNDNYPRENFGRNKPKHNGAWLIRNSWGTNWGAGGYFWLSYEQYRYSGTAYTVEPVKEKLNYYGYDDLGWLKSVNVNGKRTSYAANVFKVKNSDESLSEVGFYTTDNGAKYTVSIYNYGSSKPSAKNLTESRKPVATKSGTMDIAGYHTIKFDGIYLEEGDYFSVVLKVYTPSYNYPVAIEKYYKNYAENVVVNSGESYFSSDNKNWIDGKNFDGGSNACIKAFTVCVPDDEDDEEYYDDDDFDDDYDDDYDEDCDDDWDEDLDDECEDDDEDYDEYEEDDDFDEDDWDEDEEE